jgi:hypothetical protein
MGADIRSTLTCRLTVRVCEANSHFWSALDNYRTKKAQYRLLADPELAAASHPWKHANAARYDYREYAAIYRVIMRKELARVLWHGCQRIIWGTLRKTIISARKPVA